MPPNSDQRLRLNPASSRRIRPARTTCLHIWPPSSCTGHGSAPTGEPVIAGAFQAARAWMRRQPQVAIAQWVCSTNRANRQQFTGFHHRPCLRWVPSGGRGGGLAGRGAGPEPPQPDLITRPGRGSTASADKPHRGSVKRCKKIRPGQLPLRSIGHADPSTEAICRFAPRTNAAGDERERQTALTVRNGGIVRQVRRGTVSNMSGVGSGW